MTKPSTTPASDSSEGTSGSPKDVIAEAISTEPEAEAQTIMADAAGEAGANVEFVPPPSDTKGATAVRVETDVASRETVENSSTADADELATQNDSTDDTPDPADATDATDDGENSSEVDGDDLALTTRRINWKRVVVYGLLPGLALLLALGAR